MDFARGINIGGHYERTPVSGEPFCSDISNDCYDEIKRLGFDHVRLPVKWSAHTDDEHSSKIDSRFLDTVKDSVDNFINRGISVILNVHHFREAADEPRKNAHKLFAIWEQLADIFKNYPDSLIFEVFNEPTWRADAKEWNSVQNEAVSLIRQTNPTRKIEVCGVDYSGLFTLDYVTPPENDENLIGTFHYYAPMEFTHQGASWSATYRDVSGVHWNGTADELAYIRNSIYDHAVCWGKKYNLPLNLGEFGVYGRVSELGERAAWTKAVRDVCEEYGISWTYWEYDSGFGIRNRKTGEYVQQIVDALLK